MDNSKQSFLENWIVNTFSVVISNIFNFFIIIKIARVLNPESFGYYSFVLNSVAIFMIFSVFGMRELIIKDISKDNLTFRFYFINILKKRFIFVFFSILGLLAYLIYASNENSFQIILFASLILVFNTLFSHYESIVIGLQQIRILAIINILTAFIFLLFVIIPTNNFLSLNYILTIYSLIILIKCIALFIYLAISKLSSNDEFHNRSFKYVVSNSFPFFWITGIASVSTVGPIFFLGIFSDKIQIGFFSAAMKIANPILLVSGALLTVLLPKLSQLFVMNKVAYYKYINLFTSLLVLVGFVIAVTVSFFSNEIVSLVFGTNYQVVNKPLIVLIWTIPLSALFGFISIILTSRDKQKLTAYLATVAAVVFTTALLLFSHKGAVGVSQALLFSSLINMIYHFLFLRKIKISSLSIWYFILILSIYIGGYLISFYLIQNLSLALRSTIFFIFFMFFVILLFFVIKYFQRRYDIIISSVIPKFLISK